MTLNNLLGLGLAEQFSVAMERFNVSTMIASTLLSGSCTICDYVHIVGSPWQVAAEGVVHGSPCSLHDVTPGHWNLVLHLGSRTIAIVSTVVVADFVAMIMIGSQRSPSILIAASQRAFQRLTVVTGSPRSSSLPLCYVKCPSVIH